MFVNLYAIKSKNKQTNKTNLSYFSLVKKRKSNTATNGSDLKEDLCAILTMLTSDTMSILATSILMPTATGGP